MYVYIYIYIIYIYNIYRSRVSSGSIVSDYGLDGRAIGVRSPAGAKDFSFSLCVQTGFGAHPPSCTMGTGVLSPGVKRGRCVMLTTHPHLVPRSWMSRSYTPLPPSASMACRGTALLFYFAYSVYIYSYICCLAGRWSELRWHQFEVFLYTLWFKMAQAYFEDVLYSYSRRTVPKL
jgi:hypothetical protein